MPDVSSDVIYMNRESKTSDNRKPQLNLALEKSISGCWAMNLQRQKVSESETKGRRRGAVSLWSQWMGDLFIYGSWQLVKLFGKELSTLHLFSHISMKLNYSENLLYSRLVRGKAFVFCCKANVYFNSAKNEKLYASSEMTPSHNMFDWTDTIWPLCH